MLNNANKRVHIAYRGVKHGANYHQGKKKLQFVKKISGAKMFQGHRKQSKGMKKLHELNHRQRQKVSKSNYSFKRRNTARGRKPLLDRLDHL